MSSFTPRQKRGQKRKSLNEGDVVVCCFQEFPYVQYAYFEITQLLSHRRLGVVRYIGEIAEFNEKHKMYGIEIRMSEGVLGDCDGSVGGTAYFKCAPNEGIFVRLDQILRRIEPKELLEKVVKLKKIKTSMKRYVTWIQNQKGGNKGTKL